MTLSTSLSGRTALITGASRGLGTQIARHFAAAGAKLILAARDVAALARLAADLAPASVTCHGIDLSEARSVEQFLDLVLFGPPIDILINNAAIQGPIGEFAAVDFAAWQAVFQTNFFSPARICQRLIPPMKARHYGKIINLSGGGATSPRPHVSAYGSSKCALVRFSETLAEELKNTGIDINCVAPGPMNTAMLAEILAAGPSGAVGEYDRALKQQQSSGAPPEKAADLILFLASPDSDGITGRLLSAVWDPWPSLPSHRQELANSDIFTLRRITPEDRGKKW
jgi:NAD(P)-dependent dehydrogenase (short-subunit alcohol dehydrogenase family)